MAYNSNIPQPNDELKDSQADILENFTQIKNLIDVNHETFGSANEGKHKFVQFPEGAAPATAVDEGALYVAPGVQSLESELIFRRENNGPFIILTEGQEPVGVNPVGTWWTYLGSGRNNPILVKGGIQATPVNNNNSLQASINLNAFGPALTNVSTPLLSFMNNADVFFADALVITVNYTSSTAASLDINVVNRTGVNLPNLRVSFLVFGTP